MINSRRSLFAIAALFTALAAIVYTFLPEASVAAHFQEADTEASQEAPDQATQAMIDFALNLRTASEYSVFAARGVVERGAADIRGAKGDAMWLASGKKTLRELASSIDAVRQLPCTDLKEATLSGRSYTPGVYCVASGDVDGTLVLDGQGSLAGVFIFRVGGTLNARAGSEIRPENGAQSGNVFFVAESAEIGDGAEFRANLLSSGNVKIGSGATVTERVLALGKVELTDSSLLGGSIGSMRICTEQPQPVAPVNDISNRVFHYVVTGAVGPGTAADPVRVAVGSCSEPFQVASGPQTVTELNTGTIGVPPTGTFEGNFELVSVSNPTPTSPSTLGLVNLATRTASVNLAAGGSGSPEQLTLRFTNRHAITGFVEICSRAATGPRQWNPAGPGSVAGGDPDVTGFFQYTVGGVYTVSQQNPNIRTLQVLTIPVGQCTGPIAVTKGDPPPFDGGSGLSTTTVVSMLPRAGVYFESADVLPVERRNGPDVKAAIITADSAGNDVFTPAPGGGHLEVSYPAATSGDEATQVVFRSRSNPARLKICKVAGPGIPINTLFRFTVTGTGALNAAHPQIAQYGTVTRTFDVRAGDPAQGGSCEFVPGLGANPPGYNQFQTFINGTPISIVENGVSPDNTIAQNPGQLRNSMVRIFGTQFVNSALAGYASNPDLTPMSEHVARAAVFSRAPIGEVDFVGFRFNPAQLKICNVAATPSLVGVEHVYTVSLVSPQIGGVNPGPMFQNFVTNVTVAAGPVGSPEGNCQFVNSSSLPGGAFNQGSTVTVTRSADAASSVRNISCPSCGPTGLTSDLVNRRATLSGPEGVVAGINSVVFTNIVSDPCRPGTASVSSPVAMTSCSARDFDFDGDHKSDPVVYSPDQAHYMAALSGQSYPISEFDYGISGDRPVPADFDGDRKTDMAIWRPSTGTWYVQGSATGFTAVPWGQAGDVPQVGDFDGDRRADFFIFRPSNAMWYVRTATGVLISFQFGIPTDRPVVADYDADGRVDVGVYRNGFWYTLESLRGFRAVGFGQAGDKPVPSDFDGDGTANIAVYRPGDSNWYVLRPDGHYYAVNAGSQDTYPTPADYDGDGKTDISYYRPSEGKWYVNFSSSPKAGMTLSIGGVQYLPLQDPDTILGRNVTTIF